MNPMMAALEKSRQSNPVSSSGAVPGKMDQAPSGDMAKYWQMVQDINTKLDKVLSLIGGNAPAQDVKENNNEPGSNAY